MSEAPGRRACARSRSSRTCSAQSRCDEGFLRLRRLRLRNLYEDGRHSDVYPCDVLSRPGSDAVVAVLYEIDGARRVRVLLRDAPRAPVYLRHAKRFVHPDPRVYLSLMELVAGLVEESDGAGDAGLCRRAAIEAEEEAGVRVRAEDFRVLGGESFASPGTGDEKLRFCARADARSRRRRVGSGRRQRDGGRRAAWSRSSSPRRSRPAAAEPSPT